MTFSRSGPTDADREKAAELLAFTHRGQRVFRWSNERVTFADDDPYYAEGVDTIAAALASEREPALAPVLAHTEEGQ